MLIKRFVGVTSALSFGVKDTQSLIAPLKVYFPTVSLINDKKSRKTGISSFLLGNFFSIFLNLKMVLPEIEASFKRDIVPIRDHSDVSSEDDYAEDLTTSTMTEGMDYFNLRT